jgi:hypothetical protein
MTGAGTLRGIKHRRNALAPMMIREYLVQTDRLSADHRKRDMELTSIILSADGSQFLVPSQPVHEACIVPINTYTLRYSRFLRTP